MGGSLSNLSVPGMCVVLATLLGMACRSPAALESMTPVEDRKQLSAGLTALTRTGWTATASAIGTGNGPQNAIDTNTTNRWSTPGNQLVNQWFKVNLQAPRTFTEVTLDTTPRPTEYLRTFKVEVSNNDSTWTTVVPAATGNTPLVTVAFPSQTAQYIRITVTAAASFPWSIYDFNVYGTALSRAGWTATASSTNGTNAAGNVSTS